MKSQKKPNDLEEFVNLKQEFQEQYKQKKTTQKQAKERRNRIRELKEDHDYWN